MKSRGEHPLTVAVRVRPMNEQEILAGAIQIAHPVDKQMVVLLDPTEDPDDILRANRSRERRYMFDHAFDDTCDQEEVYQGTTRFLIDQVITGYNGTVFAYGATGAGKTHTMLGTQDNPGIYFRALNDLFRLVESHGEENIYNVSMSYLEIYNEMIRDLLNPSAGYLEMREDAKGGVQVANLSEVSTSSTREIMELLQQGNLERTQEPTKANQTSSRSHAVLQVTVKQRNRARGINSQVKIGRLFLVDLAGSERAANTQNRGKRMVEGAHINRSLLALGNCITALSESSDKGARTYVNFRDSKLTRLLKDALGGNCKTVMIAHLGPASFHFEESRNTLLYADRAKRIKNKVRRNVEDVSYHIAQYTQIIAELRSEIERLKAKVSQSIISQPPAVGIQAVQNEVLRSANDHEFFKLKEQLMMTFKEQMELRRSLMDLSNTSMEIDLECSRHTATISEWTEELNKRAELLTAGNSTDKEMYSEEEPVEVAMAQGELKVLSNEKRKVEKMRTNVTKDLEIARQKASILEESIPKYLSTDSQKEILALLLRVHELEIENIEYQSRCYLRENDLAQKDFIISRYGNYKMLVDQIISQQRALLSDNAIPVPHELQDYYEMYQQEQQALQDENVTSRLSLPNIQKGLGSVVSLVEASNTNLDRLSTLAEEPPSQYASGFAQQNLASKRSDTLQVPTTPRLVISRHSPEPENNKVFSVSPRSLAANPYLSVATPLKTKHKEDTIYTISMRSNSMESFDKRRDDSPLQHIQPKLDQLKVTPAINPHTRNIAALAKKRRQQGDDLQLGMNDSQLNRTFVSTYSADDGETRLTPSRLATHNMSYGLKYPNTAENQEILAEQRSIRTDPVYTLNRVNNSPAVRNKNGAAVRAPRATKYRPQPLNPQVVAVAATANGSSSLSDKMSDKTVEISNKTMRQQKRTTQGKQTSQTWKPAADTKRAPAPKPKTNRITSRYLKSLGSNTQISSPLYKTKPSGKGKDAKGNSKTSRKSHTYSQPTIPSTYESAGDITIAGFSLQH